ncbi:NAD(P)-binding protein [Tothia fuscella]|uniref:NAD(P)-binding protein n=1 Tax=Tothia fuscella TaxID=1048955 RepID=A0A9P4TWU9_9PEZI|nr:NAD(P)-binding protein [Tothia fuscella]
MPEAIVTGATGMLGRQIVFELAKDPKWTKIHALSRSQKDEYPKNVVHNYIDLTSSLGEMTKEVKDIKGEYLFFAAYLQKDTEQENWDVNGKMLETFLSALERNGTAADLKRIILVTGAKQYGVHIGAPKNPMQESDPWLTDTKYPPNFYYNQQNILHKFCEDQNIPWTVTYPNDVIGYAKGNFMNLATSLGIYAAVTKELGEELTWPGSGRFYTGFDSFTDSTLHAQFCIWAAGEKRAENQAFNAVNGDVESYQNLFPKIAKLFGLQLNSKQFTQPPPDENNMDLGPEPPLSNFAEELGLVGKTKPNKVEQRIDLTKWAKRDDVKQAWGRLVEREGLDKDGLEKATWGFLGFVLGRNFDLVISMSKARRIGWTGYLDTWESFEKTFKTMEQEKIIPKLKAA